MKTWREMADKTSYVPMFLEELTRSVDFQKTANLVPSQDHSYGLGLDDTYSLDDEAFTLEDIRGWQKMACKSCMIVWAVHPEPVRMSMVCKKCGGMAHNDGVF